MQSIERDVLIVGGGPAGAAAALSLLEHSKCSVALVEYSAFDTLRVGEQVSASLFDFIDYMGLQKADFEEGCFLPAYESIAYWGGENALRRNSIFTAEQASHQLDREKFDLTLIQEAANRGADIFPRSKCLRFEQQENGAWEIEAKHATKGAFKVYCRFLVDATGRHAHVCRQIGAKNHQVDHLMGIGHFLSFAETAVLPQAHLLETVENGWWYCATLPNNKMTCTFFSDADIIATHQWNQQSKWMGLLSESRQVKKWLQNGRLLSPKPWTRPAFSQIANFEGYSNFIAIGDAALAFDPIASLGIGFAISSACQAAVIIPQCLQTNHTAPSSIANYQADLYANFKQYMAIRERFYQQERRWGGGDFWKRRAMTHSILL